MSNLEWVTYTVGGKKKKIKAKVLRDFASLGTGLMFRRTSPPLLFVLNKEKNFGITSLFCRLTFKAIWLDEKMHATKIIVVKPWKFNTVGHGKYLLEIPLSQKKSENPSGSKGSSNRKV